MLSIRGWQTEFFDWGSVMPARKIGPKRSVVSITGRVATSKANAPQEFESLLEQDFLLLLEFDKAVDRFASQPITIRWEENGRKRRYTPDVLVDYTEHAYELNPHLKPTLFEIKPKRILAKNWQALRPRYKAAIRWCNQNGCRFRIVTEKYIRTPYLKNVKFLLQFTTERMELMPLPERAKRQQLIKAEIFELGHTTPQELLDRITASRDEQATLIPFIWYLFRCGVIAADLQKPLTMRTPIWCSVSGSQLAESMQGNARSRIMKILDPHGIEAGT